MKRGEVCEKIKGKKQQTHNDEIEEIEEKEGFCIVLRMRLFITVSAKVELRLFYPFYPSVRYLLRFITVSAKVELRQYIPKDPLSSHIRLYNCICESGIETFHSNFLLKFCLSL